jgi:phosphatidylglycerol:prolipoprotein diacylglycerol transferase
MHPILFKIGPLELYTYGAFLAAAFLAAIFLATRAAEREGLDAQFIADLGIVVILASIVGSRLFYILFYDLRHTLENPSELLKFRQTGLVFYGGLAAAVGAGLLYSHMKRVSLSLIIDIAAPSIALGQAIGRIGCLMSGCCFGAPTNVPWAVRFPFLEHARHPTQIYESLATFGIFLVLLWFRKRKTANGQVAWLYLVLYSAARFVIEFFRGDNPALLFGLTLSQIIGILALIAAVPLGFVVWRSSGGSRAEADTAQSAGR